MRIFSLSSFLNDLGSNMIAPIWPAFVTTILGANMAILGFIDGLGEAMVSLSQAVGGYLSDRYRKRKVFIWFGYLCAGISRIGYALSYIWQTVIPFRILDRFGKLREASRDAMIAEVSHDKNRGGNFGILRAFDNLGALVGIITVIILIRWLPLRAIFLLAALPSLLAVYLVVKYIKEDGTSQLPRMPFSFKELGRNYSLFLILSAIFSFGTFTYSFILLFGETLGISVIYAPLIYFLFTFFASTSSVPFGKLSDRIGRKKVIALALALWILMCLCIVESTRQPGWFLLATMFYGLHNGAMDTVQKTYVSELAPPHHRTTGIGGFQMVVGLCTLPGALINGILWQSTGPSAAFIYSMSMAIVAFIMLFFIQDDHAS